MPEARIAFIGTGVMGRSMAGHLLAAGHALHVFNRTRAKAPAAPGLGRALARLGGAAAAEAGVVVTMLGFPQDVEETYLAPGGIVERARPGALLVDMTTSSPLLARRIFGGRGARGLEALDAPVSGGDVGAREARLVIMAGARPPPSSAPAPSFRSRARTSRSRGPRAPASTARWRTRSRAPSGWSPGARRSPTRARGARPQAGPREHQRRGGRQLGDDEPWAPGPRGGLRPGFYVKHIRKDIGIAIASAEEMGLELPGLECARKLYDRVAAKGWEEFGTQASTGSTRRSERRAPRRAA
jgi:3-hydroxyisobutyrate dehydrogenase